MRDDEIINNQWDAYLENVSASGKNKTSPNPTT